MTSTETAPATYPCVWAISYTDFDGSHAGHGCDEAATVLFYDPEAVEQYGPDADGVFGMCSHHAETETFGDRVERVRIDELATRCTGCHRPVWLAHPQDHVTVAAADCQWCRGLAASRAAAGIDIPTATEHPRCCCPEELAYEAAMSESSS